MMHEWACCGDEAASHQLCMAAASWIIWIVSLEECSSLMQNLMLIHCPTLRHFECDSHTVHMLTQWRLLHPLTSTVKLSLFMHAHSSPSSLSARLYRYHTNSSYISNGWPFSGQTLYVYFLPYIVLFPISLFYLWRILGKQKLNNFSKII